MSSNDAWVDLLVRAAVGGARAATGTIVPVVETVQRYTSTIERSVIRAVRDHIDDLEHVTEASAVDDATPPTPNHAQQLATLLRQSVDFGVAQCRSALYESVVSSLLPDEARILAAVAEGRSYAVVHVGPQGVGSATELVLENASSVGRAAGVTLNEHTPHYVTHLHQLGLVVIGPEDADLRDEYEMLIADAPVRAAVATASPGLLPARIVRRSLKVSELGRELWEAASR